MELMQSILTKKMFFLAALLMISHQLWSQTPDTQLQMADRLFEQKRYKASLEQYRLLMQKGFYSPQMLLKMSFIAENNGNIPEAMRYLNQYYLAHPDRRVFQKINDLAAQKQLIGYEFTDQDYFRTVFNKYQIWFFSLLFCCLAIVFILMAKGKRQQQPLLPYVGALAVLMLLGFLAVNFFYGSETAIVKPQTCYLMQSPSAGASLVATIEGGHKLDILAQDDIWCKVKWQEQVAYIRVHNLWLLKS